MRRLAAVVPRPRLYLIRFHGVLAPNEKLPALVISQGPQEQAEASRRTDGESACANGRSARISWGQLLKTVFAAT